MRVPVALVPLFAVSLLAAACRPGESSWAMHPDHAGAVRFGMPAAQAMRALGDSATNVPSSGCSYWRPVTAPRGVSFMIEDGTVVRADVDSAGAKTADGVGVGSTEA